MSQNFHLHTHSFTEILQRQMGVENKSTATLIVDAILNKAEQHPELEMRSRSTHIAIIHPHDKFLETLPSIISEVQSDIRAQLEELTEAAQALSEKPVLVH